MDPEYYWQAIDAAAGGSRNGMAEVLHISGMYTLWDTLRETFPSLLIDNCASGGRRIDVETIRRAVHLWRSDYCWDDSATQVRCAEFAVCRVPSSCRRLRYMPCVVYRRVVVCCLVVYRLVVCLV